MMQPTPTLKTDVATRISELLKPVASPPKITENSDDDLLKELPELTPDEYQRVTSLAVRLARIDKANRLAEEDYYRRLKAKPYHPTAEELFYWLLEESAVPESPRYVGPMGFCLDSEWLKAQEVEEGQITWEAALNQLYTIYWALCLYFTDDPRFDTLPDYHEQFSGQHFSRQKNLALFGPVGCGKTELMKLFAHNPLESYEFIRVKEVVTAYEDTRDGYGGDGALMNFLRLASITRSPWGQVIGGWTFDDLGTEPIPGYHFKKARNCMAWILEESYAGRGYNGRRHLTTNLSGQQLEDDYGQRVRNRLRETYNMMVFNPNTPSWRDINWPNDYYQ